MVQSYTCFFLFKHYNKRAERIATNSVDVFKHNPQVQITSIGLKVDEEQWKIAQARKRLAGGHGPHARYLSALRATAPRYSLYVTLNKLESYGPASTGKPETNGEASDTQN